MTEFETLVYVNNCVAMMAPGDVIHIKTRGVNKAEYELSVEVDTYFVKGGAYGITKQKLNGVPHMERQGNFIFSDNSMFKHYVSRTPEVTEVKLNNKVIFPDGR